MGAGQRRKGASFERAVALAFSGALGREIKRHIGQARDGGHDVDATPYVIECKRRKSMKTLYGWMQQAEAASDRLGSDRIPVVIARADDENALAIVPFAAFLRLVEKAHAADAQRAAQVPAIHGNWTSNQYVPPAEHGIKVTP